MPLFLSIFNVWGISNSTLGGTWIFFMYNVCARDCRIAFFFFFTLALQCVALHISPVQCNSAPLLWLNPIGRVCSLQGFPFYEKPPSLTLSPSSLSWCFPSESLDLPLPVLCLLFCHCLPLSKSKAGICCHLLCVWSLFHPVAGRAEVGWISLDGHRVKSDVWKSRHTHTQFRMRYKNSVTQLSIEQLHYHHTGLNIASLTSKFSRENCRDQWLLMVPCYNFCFYLI